MPPRAPPASPRWSDTRGRTSTPGAIWWPARSARRAAARGMRVHVAYGYGLFTGGLGAHYGAEAAGCTVIPMSGGQTERQVQLIIDFRARHHHDHAELHARASSMNSGGRVSIPGRAALASASSARSPGARAYGRKSSPQFGIDACDIYGLSEVMGPGVAQEFATTKEGPTIWEDHFLPEIVDPESGEVLGRGRAGRAGVHLAHQGGDARDPLPHARSDAPASGKRHRDAPLRQDHRAHRRHADHPRRERVPLADRGADPGLRRALRLTTRSKSRGPHRMDEMVVRVEARAELARPSTRARRLLAHKLKAMVGISARDRGGRVAAAQTLERQGGAGRPIAASEAARAR